MKLDIKNFRSIEDQSIDLEQITVVYGPNGSGKSSLLYALLMLKNIILNPNQSPAAFFNFGFLNIGGFEQAVFDHNPRREISIGLSLSADQGSVSYKAAIRENSGGFMVEARLPDEPPYTHEVTVAFPYPLNQKAHVPISDKSDAGSVVWNGVTAELAMQQPDEELRERGKKIVDLFNLPVEHARMVDVVPLKRGFTKPQYTLVGTVPVMVTEDEMATWLCNNKSVEYKVSAYLERIFSRDFRVRTHPNVGFFSLDSTDKQTGVGCELVNEGFGVNQMVYLLARCFAPNTGLICVEEPEIHLHPSAIKAVAKTLRRIVAEENKAFVISTHSETFILALLALVAKGELKPEEVAFYLTKKDGKATLFERHEVNAKGQVSGGLATFMEAELEDIGTFLNADTA